MTDKILFVDDEVSVLDGIRRSLHGAFEVDTAVNGHQALFKINENGPYAVIVSDMRMPIMDGIQFFTRVREVAPDSVRIMLTGQNDMQQAILAVNEGRIFRFLTKPCETSVLTTALNAGLVQYRLVRAERELLENTLSGSIQVLVEVLALVNPGAFSRAMRLRKYVRHVAETLKLCSSWQLEIAAMLSQLGCVTLESELVEAMAAGKPLSPEDQKKVLAHPRVAYDLLTKIPRMEAVAWIIAQQFERSSEFLGFAVKEDQGESLVKGAGVLRAVLALDQMSNRGMKRDEALKQMSKEYKYDADVLTALADAPNSTETMFARPCAVKDLACGMILKEEVRTKTNLLAVARGQEITQPLLMRLNNLARSGVIPRTVVVLVPAVPEVQEEVVLH